MLALLVAVAAPAAQAGQTVLFDDGRSLTVEGVRMVGDTAVLVLEGGGQISLPAERIANRDGLPSHVRPTTKRTAVASVSREVCADLTEAAASRHGLDPNLLMAMIEVGSAFDPVAVSPRGAGGLMQLTPEIADSVGIVDVFDPSQAIEGGARHLSWLLARFNGRADLALAAYRTGVAAVDRHRGVPPYRETRRYVNRVLELANRLSASDA